MEKKTFKQGMRVLVASFPDKSIDVEVCWELLKDLDGKKFLIAIKDICATTSEVYPGTNFIAVIREIVLAGKYLLSGEAWEQVLSQVSSVGSYGTPFFDDPTTQKAVDCIGWKTICRSEKIAIERAHFIKIYEQLLDRTKKEEIKTEECKLINREGTIKVKELSNGLFKAST